MNLQKILDRTEIVSEYQPIIELESGDVVGSEALVRWPHLSITPDAAFAHARDHGSTNELDLLCQQAAIDGATGIELPVGFKLFVNVEPGNSVTALLDAQPGLEIVAEITERALLDDPAELLRSINAMRERGCGIALDDVGAVPDSLALMPFLAPDVIKLDLSLVRGWPNADQARIVMAVSAYAERTGTVVLAEGIETEANLQQAIALGATLGQGWYFCHAGPLTTVPSPRRPLQLSAASPNPVGTPFDLVDPAKVRLGSKGMLLSISRHLEQQGLSLQTPPLVLGAFQDGSRFTPATATRYQELGLRCPLVVALGAGMHAEPTTGVRGADLATDDNLLGEWTVVVVGTHYSGALIAHDLGDDGPDLDRRFEFVLTHHHETVIAAARILLSRVEAVRTPTPSHRSRKSEQLEVASR